MTRKRIVELAAPAWETRLRRGWVIVLAFCLLNALWSIVGDWSLNFGGESVFWGGNTTPHLSGIYSNGGYLIIAIRQGIQARWSSIPKGWENRLPERRKIPWSIQAHMDIGPATCGWRYGNGILDGGGGTTVRGLKLKWEDAAAREIYNRGIAIHWTILAAFAAVVPLGAMIRAGRQVVAGHCIRCGYDLRATPDRCPECGAVST